MSTNPYLLWICGIENTVKDDPRFDIEVRRKSAGGNEYKLGDIQLPFIPDDSLGEVDDRFDMLTGRYKDRYETVTCHDLFYEGSPMGKSAWDGIDRPIGYIIAENHDRYLMRGLYLIPGFYKLIAEKGYAFIPQLDLEENKHVYHDQCHRWPNMKGKDMVDRAIAEGRWISMYQPWETDLWFRRALWLFNFTGWTGVTRDMLKLMMVFDWS